MSEIIQTGITEDEFNLGDLDLSALTVVSMHDSAALPEGGASFKSSSTCYVSQPQ